MEETSIKKLNELIARRVDLDFEKQKVKAEERELNKRIGELDDSILKILDSVEMKQYKHPRASISIVRKESVTVPQTPHDKEIFFEWLKKEGLYDEYITVNSASINSLYKTYKEDLLAKAEATGNPGDLAEALNFLPPGIEQPSPYDRVSLSGKKKSE